MSEGLNPLLRNAPESRSQIKLFIQIQGGWVMGAQIPFFKNENYDIQGV